VFGAVHIFAFWIDWIFFAVPAFPWIVCGYFVVTVAYLKAGAVIGLFTVFAAQS